MSLFNPPPWPRRSGAGPLPPVADATLQFPTPAPARRAAPTPASPQADGRADGRLAVAGCAADAADSAESPAMQAHPLALLHRLQHDPAARTADREAAARQVLARLGPAMRDSHARRWRCSAQDVEDSLQETLLTFLTRTPADCRVPEAWFHRIFIHQLINHHRRQGRSRSLDALMEDPGFIQPVSLDLLSDPYHTLLRKQVQRYLQQALGLSSPGRAQVLALLCDGADNDEVARRLLISPGAARDCIHRVRRLVRAIFAPDL